MRLSSNEDERDAYAAYQSFLMAHGFPRVYLDGVEQSHCTLADDDTGEVRRFVLDADGDVQVDPANPEEIWIETVRGAVEIAVRAE